MRRHGHDHRFVLDARGESRCRFGDASPPSRDRSPCRCRAETRRAHATCASSPTSRAMIPASRATSAECERTFWRRWCELEPPHQAVDFRMQVVEAHRRTTSSIPSCRCRQRAARFSSLAIPLAPVGIKARKDDGARRVVDDQVDAVGGELERADVPPFAADDASLQLLVPREVRDGRFDGVLGGRALMVW